MEELNLKREEYQNDIGQLMWLLKFFMPTFSETCPNVGTTFQFPKHNLTVAQFLHKRGYVTEPKEVALPDGTAAKRYWAKISDKGVEAIEFHRNRKIILAI